MLCRFGQFAGRCDAGSVGLIHTVTLLRTHIVAWKCADRTSNEDIQHSKRFQKSSLWISHLSLTSAGGDVTWTFLHFSYISHTVCFDLLHRWFKELNYPELKYCCIFHTMTPQTCNLHHAFIPHLLLPVLLLLLQAWWGCCHPQCLDYKPPFEPQQPLVFCKEYSKFGCCDVGKDEEIAIRFYTIMDNFDHSGYVTCGKYIRSILCQVRVRFH